MKVKKLTKSKVFIPEFNGNKDYLTEEQVKIHVTKFPTTAEAGNYRKMSFNGDGSMSITYGNDATMLIRYIGNIENLEDDEKISNGKALATSDNLSFSDLISEIREYLLEAAELLEPGEK